MTAAAAAASHGDDALRLAAEQRMKQQQQPPRGALTNFLGFLGKILYDREQKSREQQEQNNLSNNSRTTVVMTWKQQQCIWRRRSTLRRLLMPIITLTLAVVASVVICLLLTEDAVSSFTSVVIHWRPPMAESHNRKYVQPSKNDDRIFFHETSGRMELSFKETCAIESAAIHNPQRPVQIFFQPQQLQQLQQQSTAAAIDQSSAWIRVLNRYANVQVIVIDDEGLYFKDSPLEDWYREGKWRNSPYRVQHMADYIRMVTLKKGGGGGMYLDLDVLTLKPYDGPQFRNFVTAKSENFGRIMNDIFHLDRGHRLIGLIQMLQAEEYRPFDFEHNGQGAMTEALADLCHLKSGKFNISCTDVHLLLPHYFHPAGTTSDDNKNVLLHDIFQRTDEPGVAQFLRQIRATSYGVHFHNFYSKHSPIDTTPNSTQVFAILAAEHCPLTFAQGPDQFFAV